MTKTLLVILIEVALLFAGCDVIKTNKNGEIALPYSNYKEVHGVTADEIDVIESLRAKKTSFVYGMNHSTETFYDEHGTIKGFSALFCEWLSELFKIPFEPAIYEKDDLIPGLSSGEIDFTGELRAPEEQKAPAGHYHEPYYMTGSIAERSVRVMRLSAGVPLSEIAASRPLKYAFMQDTAIVDDTLPAASRKFEVTIVFDYDTAYTLLKNGEIDGFVGENVTESAFDAYYDVIAEDFLPIIFNPVSMATQNKEFASVVSVVQKVLDKDGIQYFTELYKRGYREYLLHKLSVQLTDKEHEYIKNRKLRHCLREARLKAHIF